VGNRAAGDPFVPAESVDDLLGPCSAVATPGYMDRVKPEVPRFDGSGPQRLGDPEGLTRGMTASDALRMDFPLRTRCHGLGVCERGLDEGLLALYRVRNRTQLRE
jgi:hypothetical protein